MMQLHWFKQRKARKDAAVRLYDMAVVQSRVPDFYDKMGVADTIDGRFDLLVLHIYLVMDRLNALGPEGRKLGQALFDRMFRMVDLSLREMGFGDLGIPKHMKKMMKAFNGRAHSYHAALSTGNPDALQLAITRNVYRIEGESIPAGVFSLTDYALATHTQFAQRDLNAFMQGDVGFPAIRHAKEAIRA
jgi:cytochrome b pre-mRNA-processing protein 3